MTREEEQEGARAPAGTDLIPRPEPTTWGPLTKDFLVFEAKLLLDGLIDLAMTTVAAAAFLFDILSGSKAGARFYRLLGAGRRLERWVGLYEPSTRTETPKEGLARASLTSADHMIAKIEGMMREKDLPEQYRQRLKELADKARDRRAPGGGEDG